RTMRPASRARSTPNTTRAIGPKSKFAVQVTPPIVSPEVRWTAVSQSPSTESTLADLDAAVDTAMSERDAAALERLLAPDFIYTHSNGRSQPRAEFIAAIAARDD